MAQVQAHNILDQLSDDAFTAYPAVKAVILRAKVDSSYDIHAAQPIVENAQITIYCTYSYNSLGKPYCLEANSLICHKLTLIESSTLTAVTDKEKKV